ncbi:Mov34/MPN/PAD-1 family protein [Pseudomonas sp. PvR086]
MVRSNSSLRYQIPGASWSLEFPESVVLQLAAYAQQGNKSLEGVGQLYTRDLTASSVRVEYVTKIAPTWAKYTAVRLDMKAVKKERAAMFKKGLHCIGFWHSHPEPRPHVSPTDLVMAEEQARAGKTDYQGLVFMIIGNIPPPSGFGVWVHDGEKLWQADSTPG